MDEKSLRYTLFYVLFTYSKLGWILLLLISLFSASVLVGQSSQPYPKDLHFTNLEMTTPQDLWGHYHDRKGYLWFIAGGGLGRYDGNKVKMYASNPLDTNSLSASIAYFMTEDEQGKFWISTMGGGLNSFDPQTETFQHFRHDETDTTTISSDVPAKLLYDKEGMLWIGFDAIYGLNQFNPLTGKSKRFKVQKGKKGALQGRVRGRIIEDGNRIYLGTTAGLEYYDKSSGLFHHFPIVDKNGDTITFDPFPAICKSRDGKVWIGTTDDGLRFYNPTTNLVETFRIETTNGEKITASVRKIIEDKLGYLWIWTWEGVWTLSPNRQTLMRHQLRTMENGQLMDIHERSSYEGGIFMDNFGTIWFDNRYFDPRRTLFEHHQTIDPVTQQPLLYSIIHYGDTNCLFCGSERRRILYDLKRKTPIPIILEPDSPKPDNYRIKNPERLKKSNCASYLSASIKTQSRIKLFKDGKHYRISGMGYLFDVNGHLWSPTWGQGLIRVKKEVFESAKWNKNMWEIHEFDQWLPEDDKPTIPTEKLLMLMEDSQNNLWLAGNHGGLTKIDPVSLNFKYYDYQQGKNSISGNYTHRIVEDDQERLWITTNTSGLNKFDLNTEQFTVYNKHNGLYDPNLFDIDVDKEGWIWFNSDTGLGSFNPETEQFTYYNQNDGLLDWQTNFVINRALNWMFLPGNKGFHVINLDSLKNRPTQKSVLRINEIKTFDPKENKLQTRLPTDWANNNLELSHQENILDIQFAVLDFRNPVKHEYQYALTQGGEPNWIDLGNQTQLSLNQLEAGTYYLHLKGSNSDKIWATLDQPLQFTIHPPFWQSTWAYALYLLVFLGILYAFYQFNLSRQLEKVEVRQQKALNQLRTRFFTNITHEFRTPLTVILGMTEQKEHPQAMSLIQRNGQKLLQLINQLLDLSKLDTGNFSPNYQQIEIVSFSQYIGESFQSLAAAKYIQLNIYSEINELWMDMDEEKYRQIISNLLSNAIKFTPQNGKITLHLFQENQGLHLKVVDNGIGIAPSEIPHIFDRFYQVENSASKVGKGTGIGLALVKELVELLEGTIAVKSIVNQGTTFELQFPIRQTADKQIGQFEPIEVDATILPNPMPAVTQTDATKELPTLLIIEDNRDVVVYIQSVLAQQYDLQIAENGEVGIEKALAQIPDLIISDVMMPLKDGFAVVETLKQDERTSHIPIVLLTAKATQADKLTGLKYGADAYLMKPFDKEELSLKLKNLLILRQQLQAKYTSNTIPEIIIQKEPTLDDIFLEKLHTILEKNYTNVELEVDEIATAMQLSYTQLNRKLKALTNKTPAKYLGVFRLEKAKALLINPTNDLNVSEVAYQVGFTDPNYFSRRFGVLYGKSPNAMRKSTY